MLTRRKMLKAVGVASFSAVAAPGLLRRPGSRAEAAVLPAGIEFDPAPFTLGVASGYPTSHSVTLWTRLAPEPLAGDGGLQGPVEVRWAVAETEEGVEADLARATWRQPAHASGGAANGPLASVVASGSTIATAESGHSVHVDVRGLEPGGVYHYGFAAQGAVSVVGRTRTAPDGPTEHLRFAVASCQNFTQGFYAALGHIAEEDIDFVLHVGDYIYESGATQLRQHIGGRVETPEQFRVRHALYKGDPNLRKAHASHPWIMTWDDHEVRNNYAGSHQPGDVAQLRTGGYKAYYEHLPIRLTEQGPPDGPSFRIYQQVAFGDLMDVALTDTRQYRDPQPLPTDPDKTMLGREQKAWLEDVLGASTAAWRVLATSAPLTQWQVGGAPQEVNDALNSAGLSHHDKFVPNNDQWDNYAQERYDLLKFIHDEGIKDVVSLSGEVHRHFWSNVRLDMDNPLSPVVVSEFTGTAITSNNGESNENETVRPPLYATNPHIRYIDGDHHGYMLCDVTKERWRTTARTIQHSRDPALDARTDPDATIRDSAVFEVARGNPELQHVSGAGASPFPG